MNVLVVDDQYVNRYLLEKLLIGNGFSVFSAEDGFEALLIAQNNPLDLIISDILLPKMDGFQFCREIKSDPLLKKIPFIFYTAAYNEKKDQDFAESLGADRFVVKPVDPAEFITIIKELLSDLPFPDAVKGSDISDSDYLSEYNRRLFRQLEKKIVELEDLNKALMVSEERYRNLFEQASDAIILHEISIRGVPGRILEANKAACSILEYTHEELLGMQVPDIDSPGGRNRYGEIISKLGILGYLTFEGEHFSKSGRIIPVEINAHLYPDPTSGHCLSICRNITERKKAEAELTCALKAIDQNLYSMSLLNDRIRNPLAVILSSCEMCNNGDMKGHVQEAIRAVDDLVTKIDNGWIESEAVRNYLRRYYSMDIPVPDDCEERFSQTGNEKPGGR